MVIMSMRMKIMTTIMMDDNDVDGVDDACDYDEDDHDGDHDGNHNCEDENDRA